ncbi:hypothetical protein ACA910_016537 [Epithemia clementina (nom. ined.)]
MNTDHGEIIKTSSNASMSLSSSGHFSTRAMPLLSSSSLCCWSWLIAVLFVIQPCLNSAYPVMITLESGEPHRCLEFSIPEDDDAHIVTLPLPDEQLYESPADASAVELFYIEQVYKMTKQKTRFKSIPKSIPDDPPDAVAQAMSKFLIHHGKTMKGPGNKAPVIVSIHAESYEGHQDETEYKDSTRFFTPLVLNHVRKHHSSEAAENYESMEICFVMDDQIFQEDYEHQVHMVFDVIMVSEDVTDLDPQPPEPGFAKEKHLTPLETSLDASINSARQVLREYKYMEQREQRMRQTADGINARVHYFSYISVAILFGVTYLQVGYLKRYFKKKKLM